MAYRDYQHFLEVLESKGELKKIQQAVSPALEITEIADRVMKAAGPALLFEKVVGPRHRLGTPNPRSAVMGIASIYDGSGGQATPGTGYGVPGHPVEATPPQQTQVRSSSEPNINYEFSVAINTMGSRRRMSLALSCEDYEEHAERIDHLLKPEIPNGKIEALKKVFALGGELKSAPTKTAKGQAKCQQVVWKGDDIDLAKLPILTCWPEDGGPFITLPLVFSHDPNTGKRNVGMYRVQLHDEKTCGIHWQMHKTGMRQMEEAGDKSKNLEICVCLGGDPVYNFAAIAPLPPGIDEMLFAGFLRKDNVRMVKATTVDVEVPEDCEIVIEGYVDPTERRLEGPFGDHTGYYSLADQFPVLHVTAVTMRDRAVYPATIVGVPPMEDAWMGKAVERIFLPMIRLTVPEIVDMNLPVEATFHNMAFVSIKKKYPGHAYKVMNAIWGLGGLAFTKFVFIFDEDANVQDLGEMLFRIGANCDPGRDSLVTRGPVDQLDHASVQVGFGGKMGFDCTHKWPGENGFTRDFPKRIVMAQDVKAKIDALWPSLGL